MRSVRLIPVVADPDIDHQRRVEPGDLDHGCNQLTRAAFRVRERPLAMQR